MTANVPVLPSPFLTGGAESWVLVPEKSAHQLALLVSLLLIQCLITGVADAEEADAALFALDFEQLMELEVSTAARKKQRLSHTAAAAHVITRDDIRRSGATSLPEALRLAPGVIVARLTPSKWAVSIRGFTGRFANKLLVLMDGRTVYSPNFAGVYWEINDLPLSEVERIEVIRGPGATLWGSNAMNGVINIITRSAEAGHGGMSEIMVGDQERSGLVRWGGAIGKAGYLRLYAKVAEGDAFNSLEPQFDPQDDYERQQIGFRTDWVPSGLDQWSFQGDFTRLHQNQAITVPDFTVPEFETTLLDASDAKSFNLLARWERSISADSEIQLQAYYDSFDRNELSRDEAIRTIDLDLQHRFAVGRRHELIWGLGYRRSDIDITPNETYNRKLREVDAVEYVSGFIQSDIELLEDRLRLTLGSKVERNDLSGEEWQPNLRLLWTPDEDQSLWASVAKAVRAPSVGERDYSIVVAGIPPLSEQNPAPIPAIVTVVGSEEFDSESLIAYELGYRRRFGDSLSLDAAAYYHDYDQQLLPRRDGDPLLTSEGLLLPLINGNDMSGVIKGFELTLDWRPSERWRVRPSVTYLNASYDIGGPPMLPEERELSLRFREGTDPELQWQLRLGWSPHDDLDLDLWLRSVSETNGLGISSVQQPLEVEDYTTLDLRAAWRPQPDLEIALTGKNLLDPSHLEGIEEIYPAPAEVPRSVLATVRLSF